MTKTARALLLLALTVFIPVSSSVYGVESSAEGVLRKIAAASRDIKSVQSSYVTSIRLNMGGQDFALDIPVDVTVEKPDKFRVEIRNPLASMTVVSDGVTLWQYIPMLNQVKITDAPKSFEEAPPEVNARLRGMGMGLFDETDSEESIKQMAKTAKFWGTRRLDGRDTYVMQINHPKLGPAKVWIGTIDYQLYKAEMSMDLGSVMGNASSPAPQEKMLANVVILAKQMKINKPVPPEIFKFKVPEGASAVKEFNTAAPAGPSDTPAQ